MIITVKSKTLPENVIQNVEDYGVDKNHLKISSSFREFGKNIKRTFLFSLDDIVLITIDYYTDLD